MNSSLPESSSIPGYPRTAIAQLRNSPPLPAQRRPPRLVDGRSPVDLRPPLLMPRMPGNELPAAPPNEHVSTCLPCQTPIHSRAYSRPHSRAHPRHHRSMNCPPATQNAINRVTPSPHPSNQHVSTCFPYQTRIHSRARPRAHGRIRSMRDIRDTTGHTKRDQSRYPIPPPTQPTRFNVFPVPDANSFASRGSTTTATTATVSPD